MQSVDFLSSFVRNKIIDTSDNYYNLYLTSSSWKQY